MAGDTNTNPLLSDELLDEDSVETHKSRPDPITRDSISHERFHHFTTEPPPNLTLPYKYRLLSELFRRLEHVVCIFHNRNEVCTFSKLKTALHELNIRNFKEHHLGQIKTVFPEAYELKQKKGLNNTQSFRNPGYQLTVEARLHPKEETGSRGTFKASDLLTRRNHFNNRLINVVKKHHKEFLANLDRPLSIPDVRITRWHPRFPLEEIPDIHSALLPNPPDVQMYQTAKDDTNTKPFLSDGDKFLGEDSVDTPKPRPAPPPLTLPYKYRLLYEHFQAMDQVVSILHNRNEVCTFSKLKAAVQELNKSNFEEHHLGQIMTVFPEAYEFRQEKKVPYALRFRNHGYELTVEARLHPKEETGSRGTFKATDLLTRRNHFNNSLINVVKKLHKGFLANLDRPLSIPDEKITRWHPRFPLDEVPEIDYTLA